MIHGSAIYDLPVGRGRQFGTNMPKALDYVVGGWTTTELVRLNSGFPYIVYLSDTNQLGDLTHSARPDILTGVPLVNPLYSSSCPTGAGCQPYVNPSAFMRPPLGQLGECAANTGQRARAVVELFRYVGAEEHQHRRERKAALADSAWMRSTF